MIWFVLSKVLVSQHLYIVIWVIRFVEFPVSPRVYTILTISSSLEIQHNRILTEGLIPFTNRIEWTSQWSKGPFSKILVIIVLPFIDFLDLFLLVLKLLGHLSLYSTSSFRRSPSNSQITSVCNTKKFINLTTTHPIYNICSICRDLCYPRFPPTMYFHLETLWIFINCHYIEG